MQIEQELTQKVKTNAQTDSDCSHSMWVELNDLQEHEKEQNTLQKGIYPQQSENCD